MSTYHNMCLTGFLILFLSNQWKIVNCHKREKRFIHFPPKSNVVITMSLLKLFPTESIANTLTELDVVFPLPLKPFQEDLHPRKKRELERNVIFSKLKDVGDFLGFSGDACLHKFICELNKSIPPSTKQKDNLLRDIVDIVFMPNITVPNGCQAEKQTACFLI